MCESIAYLVKNGINEKIMENVIAAEPQGDSVFLEDILGDQRLVKGRLTAIKLLDHKILIEA